MLPFALARESFEGRNVKYSSSFSTKKIIKQRQGTFLHQARRAKVQERRQQATLYDI